MRFVEKEDERKLALDLCETRKISGVAVHAEDGFGQYDLELLAWSVGEKSSKFIEMVVRKDAHVCAGGANGIDERRVNEFVDQEAHAAPARPRGLPAGLAKRR